MALAVPRIRLRMPVPVASRPASVAGLAAADAETGDTMNVLAADDLEAADLLALARLDDDGAPPAVTPPRRYTYPGGSAPRPPSQPGPPALPRQPGSRPAP